MSALLQVHHHDSCQSLKLGAFDDHFDKFPDSTRGKVGHRANKSCNFENIKQGLESPRTSNEAAATLPLSASLVESWLEGTYASKKKSHSCNSPVVATPLSFEQFTKDSGATGSGKQNHKEKASGCGASTKTACATCTESSSERLPAKAASLEDKASDPKDEDKGIHTESEKIPAAQVETEITVKHLLAQGMRLLDLIREDEDGFEEDDLMEKAVSLFNMAVGEARIAGLVHLEARSLYGLGTAFSECEDRKPAAGPLFQLAADLFILSGDTSDAVTSVLNATEIYLQTDCLDDAIDCYQRYDKRIDSGGLFADQLVQLILQQQQQQQQQ